MSTGFTIPTAFTAIDKMTGPMGGISRSFDSLADKAQTAAARMERSMRKIHNGAQNIATTTGIAAAAIIAPLMLANKTADDFESKMSNVSTLVDTAKEDMNDMGKQTLGIFQRVPVALDDLTTGLYQVRSAAVPASMAMDELEQSARLSVSGLSNVTEATNLMTSSFNVFKSEALTANQRADLFFKTVKAGKTTVAELSESFGSTAPVVNAAGVKMLDYQAATAALTLSGLKASEAQHQIAASVMALLKPTTEMQKIFHSLNVKDGRTLIEKMHGLSGAFEAIERTGSKAGVNLAKAWGRKEAFTAVTLLNGSQNTAYIQNLKDMASGISDVDAAFQKQMLTSNNIEKIARNNAQTLSITIGQALSPMLDKLTKQLVPIIQGFTAWMERNPQLTETIVNAALAIGGLLIAASALSSAIALLTTPIGLISAGIAALAVAAIFAYHKSEKFREGVDALWQATKPLLASIWDLAKTLAQLLKPVLVSTAILMVDTLGKAFSIVGHAVDLVSGIFSKFTNMMGNHSWMGGFSNSFTRFVLSPLEKANFMLTGISVLLDRLFPKAPEPLKIDPSAQSAAMAFINHAKPVGVLAPASAQKMDSVSAPLMELYQRTNPDSAPLIDNSDGQLQQLLQLMNTSTLGKQSLDLNISSAPGLDTTVTRSSSGLKPNVKSTLPTRQGY